MLELGGAPLRPPIASSARSSSPPRTCGTRRSRSSRSSRDGLAEALAHQRDYWLGTTLFEMRRRYGDAGEAAARRLRRRRDSPPRRCSTARVRCRAPTRTTKRSSGTTRSSPSYPHTAWAEEAQFLSGWLEFNRGHYKEAIAPLEESLAKYPHSRSGSTTRCGSSACRTTSSASGTRRATQLAALAKLGGCARGRQGHRTGSRGSTSASSNSRRRDRRLPRDDHDVSVLVVRAARARAARGARRSRSARSASTSRSRAGPKLAADGRSRRSRATS